MIIYMRKPKGKICFIFVIDNIRVDLNRLTDQIIITFSGVNSNKAIDFSLY